MNKVELSHGHIRCVRMHVFVCGVVYYCAKDGENRVRSDKRKINQNFILL